MLEGIDLISFMHANLPDRRFNIVNRAVEGIRFYLVGREAYLLTSPTARVKESGVVKQFAADIERVSKILASEHALHYMYVAYIGRLDDNPEGVNRATGIVQVPEHTLTHYDEWRQGGPSRFRNLPGFPGETPADNAPSHDSITFKGDLVHQSGHIMFDGRVIAESAQAFGAALLEAIKQNRARATKILGEKDLAFLESDLEDNSTHIWLPILSGDRQESPIHGLWFRDHTFSPHVSVSKIRKLTPTEGNAFIDTVLWHLHEKTQEDLESFGDGLAEGGMMGTQRIVVIQNSEEEAGVFGAVPKSLGLPVQVIKAYESDQRHLIPSNPEEWDWDNIAAVVVMGGPANVYENKIYPWLNDLTKLIRYVAEKQEVPYLGICLGAQLLARAVGGNVTRGPRDRKALPAPEVGPRRVNLTPDGKDHPIFNGFPGEAKIRMLHGDTIEFKKGKKFSRKRIPIQQLLKGVRRGKDGRSLLQAFAVGIAVGILGHPEAADDAVLKSWEEVPQTKPSVRRL